MDHALLRGIAVDFAYYLHVTKQSACSHEKQKNIFDEWYAERAQALLLERPNWLTDVHVNTVKEYWRIKKDGTSNRIKAVRFIQDIAKQNGFEIGIKKANELREEFCS